MLRSLASRVRLLASRSDFRDLRRDGTPEIVVASTLLAVLAYDQYLQRSREATLREERESFLRQMAADADEAGDERRRRSRMTGRHHGVDATREGLVERMDDEEWKVRRRVRVENADRPSLFRCTVRRVPRPGAFDGSMSLTGVEVGDVVDVIEEGVGPGGTYNLCRTTTGTAGRENDKGEALVRVGWYPIWFLERLADRDDEGADEEGRKALASQAS